MDILSSLSSVTPVYTKQDLWSTNTANSYGNCKYAWMQFTQLWLIILTQWNISFPFMCLPPLFNRCKRTYISMFMNIIYISHVVTAGYTFVANRLWWSVLLTDCFEATLFCNSFLMHEVHAVLPLQQWCHRSFEIILLMRHKWINHQSYLF